MKFRKLKSYFVYILKCSDSSYYTGSTSDIEKRFNEHKMGKFEVYTKTRLPVELVYSNEFYDPKEAVQAERKIKGWSRKKKEALINGDYDLLHELSECKNETHYRNQKNENG
jgi:putative endonuclease